MFDESLIEKLPENVSLAGKRIVDAFTDLVQMSQGNQSEFYDEYLNALSITTAFCEAQGLKPEYPKLGNDRYDNIAAITEFMFGLRSSFDQLFTSEKTDQYKRLIDKKYAKGFIYEFSDGDSKRLQVLIDELRLAITAAKALDEDHKFRLLKKLEKLQTELHKKVSDLDRFWGLVGDMGVILAKLGNDAKPIVDRVREIVDIIWKVEARAEELPSNLPLQLPGTEDG